MTDLFGDDSNIRVRLAHSAEIAAAQTGGRNNLQQHSQRARLAAPRVDDIEACHTDA